MAILSQLQNEPVISVGIMTSDRIEVEFVAGFGELDGTVRVIETLSQPVVFNPGVECGKSVFELKNVVIGHDFHWQQAENLRFNGALRIQPSDDGSKITAVNLIPLELYLQSVISSEMAATSSMQLLRTHAIISRSWLLFQLYGHVPDDSDAVDSPGRLIRWYDREAHVSFDVCADDHCQRYQGVTRQTSPAVALAVAQTRGLVLVCDGEICDARFSKCCGGVTERFSSCWQPVERPYLRVLRDAEDECADVDLTDEGRAREFIMSREKSFCNVADKQILRQVLNSYDLDTPDFYRWRVVYSPEQLRHIIRERSGVDYGEILQLQPVRRGPSARIVELKIVGTERTRVIGKELEIRRTLSPSHLYSSAFVVDRDEHGNWVLSGAGWGHGVGLCQIGAAMMAASGYGHDEILRHYFPGTDVLKIY